MNITQYNTSKVHRAHPHRIERIFRQFRPPEFTKEFQTIHEFIKKPKNFSPSDYQALTLYIVKGLLNTAPSDPNAPKESLLLLFNNYDNEIFKRGIAILLKKISVDEIWH